MLKRILVLQFLAVLATFSTVAAQASTAWDPAGLQMTRAELQELLDRYEVTARSDAYSAPVKAQARAEAELIRQRLEEGDIRAGDRIMMTVEGQVALSDTFAVMGNRSIVLPQIGEIPLSGILRSELQSHLTTRLAAFIRDPVVHARSLIRLGILGAVTQPGYYTVPSDMLFTDALMLAGGPMGTADLTKMSVERGDKTIWSKTNLTLAVQEGRTLDQMSIRAGDDIQVPERQGNADRMRNLIVILSSITSIVVVAGQLGIF